MNTGFFEGRGKVQMLCEMENKMTIGSFILPSKRASSPRQRCLRLGEELENLDGRRGSFRSRCLRLGRPESK